MSRWDVFQDQVIVITGAASGFGRILANTLSVEGAKLVLADINAEPLARVAAELALPDNAVTTTCDVAVELDVKALVEQARDVFGRLNIMVNNAGLGTAPKLLIDTTEEDMDINYAVNTKGVFFGIKYGIRQMLAQSPPGGIVLNVASMAGIGGAPTDWRLRCCQARGGWPY
jgi:NAD(P)-dependent dehydrogenase (short-subunit alcohol dehydrogenase family)